VRHDACIGVLLAELRFPGNRSLKDKRAPLASLRDMMVLAASSLQQARERLDDIERYLFAQDFEVSRIVLKTTDPVGALWDIDS
jgi:hypothetical protein